MLKLVRVSKYYHTGNQMIQALRRINLECHIGEFIAITGESGSGKSTLLNVMSGLDTYEEGTLYFNGQDISHYSVEELEHYRKDYIGYVFQEFNIIESYTVYQNIELALIVQGYPNDRLKTRINELIEQVGLTHVAHQKASQLSGGEKQRTVIARTLAKEYQLLVCDEPTGNLNESAAKEIFQILRDISKDKLVIVVTHDVRLVDHYATRKIRLYDGEIVEDTRLTPLPNEGVEAILPKESHTSFWGSLAIGFRNIVSVPKKTLFTLFTILFLLTTLFFVYSAGIIERNQSIETTNPYFVNPFSSRILLVKDDFLPFTADELTELEGINDVLDVVNNDLVFDSVFMTSKYDEESLRNRFWYFYPKPAVVLEETDLVGGRLPQDADEVVISESLAYELGDDFSIANSYMLSPNQMLQTDQYLFTIVGFVEGSSALTEDVLDMYLTKEGLERLAPSSIHENSEMEILIQGTRKYDMGTDTWITPDVDESVELGHHAYVLSYPTWVDIDNTLANGELLTFDMMYFDMCRDFGYKIEVLDDFEAGLCDTSAFLASHTFTFRANTPFENDHEFEPITLTSVAATDEDQSQKLYMNEATYRTYFGEENYQISVIVRGSFEANRVMNELADRGYHAFYPAAIIDSEQAIEILLRNILVTVIVMVLFFAIFFVSFFVLRNLIFSKLKDYLIMRSIGVTKPGIKRILRAEVLGTTLFGVGVFFAGIVMIKNQSLALQTILRYLLWYDYALVFLLVLFVMNGMVAQFTKKIFQASVIAALKGAER